MIRDLELFPRAYAVPMQWPTNAWQREAAEKTVREFLAPYRDRILEPVATLSATKLLLQDRLPGALPTVLANACRSMAHQVLDLLQLSIEDDGTEQEGIRPQIPGATLAPPGSISSTALRA